MSIKDAHAKRKSTKDKQGSTKHTHTTKDQVTQPHYGMLWKYNILVYTGSDKISPDFTSYLG